MADTPVKIAEGYMPNAKTQVYGPLAAGRTASVKGMRFLNQLAADVRVQVWIGSANTDGFLKIDEPVVANGDITDDTLFNLVAGDSVWVQAAQANAISQHISGMEFS